MQNRNYTYFNQGDNLWASEKLAGGNQTIKQSGCALCCVGMIVNKNPKALNEYLINNNGFQGNLISWTAANGLGVTYAGNCQSNEVIDKFNQGFHVILVVKNGGHFVLMVGYDNDNLQVLDPGSKNTTSYKLNQVTGGRIYKNK